MGAELRRLALALGLHALIHRLAVLLRQIGAPDAHVDDVDAVALGLAVELLADAPISCARSSRTRALNVDSPSTRRSAELSSVESCELAAGIVPTA